MSQLATGGLSAAFDHLDAVRWQIETRRLFVYAPLSLARSALLGAAQAGWLLADSDRSVRLRRSRVVVEYMYTEHERYLRLLRGIAGGVGRTPRPTSSLTMWRCGGRRLRPGEPQRTNGRR